MNFDDYFTCEDMVSVDGKEMPRNDLPDYDRVMAMVNNPELRELARKLLAEVNQEEF